MQTFKIIAIIALMLIGFHLLLYGYLRRRIAAARARAMMQERSSDAKSNMGGDNQH